MLVNTYFILFKNVADGNHEFIPNVNRIISIKNISS